MDFKLDLSLANGVQKAGVELAKRFNDKDIKDNTLSDYQIILLPIFNEARSYLDSIVYLCEGNFPYQAAIVIRTYFEVYITTKYLRLYPQYVERYLAFADYLKKIRILDVEKHGETIMPPAGASLTREDVFKKADEANAKFKFNGRNWYPAEHPSLYDLCRAIDEKMEGSKEVENYDLFYRYVSGYSHFSAIGFDKHTMSDVDGKKLINIKDCSGQEHLNAAISFTLAILQHINLSFELGFENNLDDLQRELVKRDEPA